MPLGLTEIEKATLGWGAVNQLCAPCWIISTPAHAEATSDDRYKFKWQLKGTLRHTHIWLTSPTKWFKNVTSFSICLTAFYLPLNLWGFLSYLFLFFFYLPLAVLLQGKSRLAAGISLTLRARLIPNTKAAADVTVLSLCSRLYLQCKNNNQNSVLEASFFKFSFISVTKYTPRVWQLKEKIHPQVVIHCLISSVCDVLFDGMVFCLSQFFSSNCWM